MSKGSKRPGWRVYERRWRELTPPLPPQPASPPETPRHLTMTDAEIDAAFWWAGKREKNRLKQEAATRRLRLAAQAELENEKEPTPCLPQRKSPA